MGTIFYLECQVDIYCASLFCVSEERTGDRYNNNLRGIFIVQSLLQLCEFVQCDLLFLVQDLSKILSTLRAN